MAPKADRCKACGKGVQWAQLASGKRMPLDLEVQPRPLPKLVAYNWSTGGGRVLSREDVESGAAAKWLRAAKVTIHYSHLIDMACPMVRARRKRDREAATT